MNIFVVKKLLLGYFYYFYNIWNDKYWYIGEIRRVFYIVFVFVIFFIKKSEIKDSWSKIERMDYFYCNYCYM